MAKDATENKIMLCQWGGVSDTLTTCYARASATNFLGSETTGVKPYNTRLVCVMVIVSKEKYEEIQNCFVEQR